MWAQKKVWDRLVADDLGPGAGRSRVRFVVAGSTVCWAIVTLFLVLQGWSAQFLWITILSNLQLFFLGLALSAFSLVEYVRFGSCQDAYVKFQVALGRSRADGVDDRIEGNEHLTPLTVDEVVMAALSHHASSGKPFRVVSRLGSLRELEGLAALLQKLSTALSNFGVQTLPVEVFTYFESTLVESKGFDQDWSEWSTTLAPLVEQMVDLSRLRWYCIPPPPVPWKCLIDTSGRVLGSANITPEIWWRFEGAPVLQQLVSSVLDSFLSTCQRIRVVSSIQVLNLQELSAALNMTHLGDWGAEGYRFGKLAELTMTRPNNLLKWTTHKDAGDCQDKEDKHYRLLAREILRAPCRVTTYWPLSLTSDSLHYAASNSIAGWQAELMQHLAVHDTATATRYLGLSVSNEDGLLRLRDEFVCIERPHEGFSGKIRYKDLVVSVIAAYFARAISLRNCRLFLVPLSDDSWDAYARSMACRNAACGATEALRRVKDRAFESDWVLFERDQPSSFVVLQFDERLQVGTSQRHLLVHRYGIHDVAVGTCGAAEGVHAGCPVADDRILSPVCCFRQSLATFGGTYQPRPFVAGGDCFGLWDEVQERHAGGTLTVPGSPEDEAWPALWEKAWRLEIAALETRATQ